MAQVVLEDISCRYDTTVALDRIALTIPSGQFLTLLGPSGCGKSTTLRVIAGLLQPSGGRVLFEGRDVTSVGSAKRNIGMVFQSLALFPHMTAAENVAFGLKMRKVDVAEIGKRVRRMLDVVRLGHLADRYPAQLSGGQQQRVALARALVIEPSILILDEPFAALDRKLREAMQVELRQITQELRTTSLFVTHDQEEALTLSDLVAVMNNGRIEQIGSPGEIFRRPKTRFVADFMGITNFLDGKLVGASATACRIEAAGIAFEAAPVPGLSLGQGVSVAIRPAGIKVTSGQPPGGIAMPGCVRQSNYHGSICSYVVDLDSGPTLIVRESNDDLPEHASARFPVGARVWAGWRREAVHLFADQ
ncbi:MAG: ABC transporter ATP-binding protein [Xanthobacteraceae bacterium]|nr:ABC transporter ATP-binding protein [Xanthobacteraceae bacterium]